MLRSSAVEVPRELRVRMCSMPFRFPGSCVAARIVSSSFSAKRRSHTDPWTSAVLFGTLHATGNANKNPGKGYNTEPINATKHAGVVTLL